MEDIHYTIIGEEDFCVGVRAAFIVQSEESIDELAKRLFREKVHEKITRRGDEVKYHADWLYDQEDGAFGIRDVTLITKPAVQPQLGLYMQGQGDSDEMVKIQLGRMIGLLGPVIAPGVSSRKQIYPELLRNEAP